MTTYKPWFARPIEILSTSNTWYRISYDVQGVGTTDVDITAGVYSCLPSLLYALSTKATGGGLTVSWSLVDYNSTGVLRTQVTTSTASKVTIGSNLAVILGDPLLAMNDSYATTHTSDYSPTHCWTPSNQCASQDRWHLKHKNSGNGSIAQTGELIGNRCGPDIYYRRLRFVNEPATNMYKEAAVNTYQDDYCMDAFVLGSMWSSPTEAGNPSTRGFFLWNDWNDMLDNSAIFPGGLTGIATDRLGIQYDLTSTPNLFTFCQFDLVDFPTKASHQYGKVYYDTDDFEIHTIDDMPTWLSPHQHPA